MKCKPNRIGDDRHGVVSDHAPVLAGVMGPDRQHPVHALAPVGQHRLHHVPGALRLQDGQPRMLGSVRIPQREDGVVREPVGLVDVVDGIFTSLIAFRDGLVANDRTAIGLAAGDIGREIDTVLTARGEVGSRMRRLQMTADRLGEEELALRTSISGLEEVDLTQEVVELQMRDTAFQASLSATARSLGTSLLDFLR